MKSSKSPFRRRKGEKSSDSEQRKGSTPSKDKEAQICRDFYFRRKKDVAEIPSAASVTGGGDHRSRKDERSGSSTAATEDKAHRFELTEDSSSKPPRVISTKTKSSENTCEQKRADGVDTEESSKTKKNKKKQHRARGCRGRGSRRNRSMQRAADRAGSDPPDDENKLEGNSPLDYIPWTSLTLLKKERSDDSISVTDASTYIDSVPSGSSSTSIGTGSLIGSRSRSFSATSTRKWSEDSLSVSDLSSYRVETKGSTYGSVYAQHSANDNCCGVPGYKLSVQARPFAPSFDRNWSDGSISASESFEKLETVRSRSSENKSEEEEKVEDTPKRSNRERGGTLQSDQILVSSSSSCSDNNEECEAKTDRAGNLPILPPLMPSTPYQYETRGHQYPSNENRFNSCDHGTGMPSGLGLKDDGLSSRTKGWRQYASFHGVEHITPNMQEALVLPTFQQETKSLSQGDFSHTTSAPWYTIGSSESSSAVDVMVGGAHHNHVTGEMSTNRHSVRHQIHYVPVVTTSLVLEQSSEQALHTEYLGEKFINNPIKEDEVPILPPLRGLDGPQQKPTLLHSIEHENPFREPQCHQGDPFTRQRHFHPTHTHSETSNHGEDLHSPFKHRRANSSGTVRKEREVEGSLFQISPRSFLLGRRKKRRTAERSELKDILRVLKHDQEQSESLQHDLEAAQPKLSSSLYWH